MWQLLVCRSQTDKGGVKTSGWYHPLGAAVALLRQVTVLHMNDLLSSSFLSHHTGWGCGWGLGQGVALSYKTLG